ncbi:hypothetical protein BGW80DRAFT_1317029 [Lactifluus volemus]|nr:hypothetical protein BGW80DRAFT_1317029 [Lactifluus volemus]
MFGRNVEVECKLEIPTSYPVSDNIPLRLIMTSNAPESVDLVSLSHTADVRLFKVLAFGNNANSTRPLTLKDRGSYHHKDTIAEVRWELDGRPEDQERSSLRTRVVLNGEFRRKEGVEIRPSFSQGDLTLKYVVCLFPFRASHFRPAGNPKKALFMANLPLKTPK